MSAVPRVPAGATTMRITRLTAGIAVLITAAAGCSGSRDSALERLKAADPLERQRAVKALADSKDPATLSPLIAAMQDDQDEDVRDAAAHALGWRRDSRAVPALLKKVSGQDRLSVRASALMSLGNIGDPSCIPALIALWERERVGDDGVIQQGVVDMLLNKFGPSRQSFQPLIDALEHPNWSVRDYAIDVFELIGDRRAREKIAPLVQDPNPVVRARAERAQEKLK